MSIGNWVQEWALSQKLICTYKEEIPSTNTFAKEFNQPNDSLVITDYQPQGRGRSNNTWQCPKKGTSLLSSWVFVKEVPPQPILSPLVGLAVYTALKTTFKLKSLSIKAPNDIYLGSKKLGGILIEIETQGILNKVIIGIGINILDKPSLDIATSLKANVKTEIKKQTFHNFLTQLKINLEEALLNALKTELQDQTRKELLKALNNNPNLKEKYKDILTDGSLQTKKEILLWSEL